MMIFDIVGKKKEVMCKRIEKKKSSRRDSMESSSFFSMQDRWKNKLNTQIIEKNKQIRFFS
jgi:hypothetical protein